MTHFQASQYSEKNTDYFGSSRTDIERLLPDVAYRVLEIGCGAGATMRWLRSIRRVEHASGIELVPEVAAKANAVFDKLIIGDIENISLQIAPKSLDLILALDVLEHLIDPWKVVASCSKLLKPGGVMIVSLPNIAHYSVSLPLIFRGRWRYETEGLLDQTHLRFFVARSAVELMTRSGLVFDQIEITRRVPGFLVGIPNKFGGAVIRWYALKLMNLLPKWHLIDFRFLIRVKAPG